MINFGNLNGITSLFIFCIEVIFFINMLIFSEKNGINKLAFGMVTLLFTYQFIEFLICYVKLQSPGWIYLAYIVIGFLPPLGFYFVSKFTGEFYNKYTKLVFLPILIFMVVYAFQINNFEVIKCTPFFADYSYPYGDVYGFFYYLPVVSVIFMLWKFQKSNKDKLKRKLSIVLLTGYLLAFIPGWIFAVSFSGALAVVESLLCKLAFFLVIAFAYFAITNKTNNLNFKN